MAEKQSEVKQLAADAAVQQELVTRCKQGMTPQLMLGTIGLVFGEVTCCSK
jgi:hypothetical protein